VLSFGVVGKIVDTGEVISENNEERDAKKKQREGNKKRGGDVKE